MAKSLEELLLSSENQMAASAAVRDAVERTDVLKLRRAARQKKEQREKKHRDLHRRILLLINGPQGEWIRQQAHEQINKWERYELCNPRYWVTWREWLAMPAPYFEAVVLRDDELGVSMRQNSPFSAAFSLVRE